MTPSLWKKVKKDSEKADFKTQHSKNKDHGSGPIISWQIDEETMESETGFIFLGSKITADGGHSNEIKKLWPTQTEY